MLNLPHVTDEQITEQLALLSQMAENGEITQWIDSELLTLQETNPILYEFVVDRSQKFAHGAVMVNSVHAIAISFALEYMVLLRIMGRSMEDAKGLETFSSMMDGLFKGKGIEGYDKLDEDNSK